MLLRQYEFLKNVASQFVSSHVYFNLPAVVSEKKNRESA